MTEPNNFAHHNIHLETARLKLRPFKDEDFDTAIPFYRYRFFNLGGENYVQ